MSARNNKPQEMSNQREATQRSVDQQTRALASVALTTSTAQSTTPKSAQESDDVIYTNHFPCSFADKLTFYQYDVVAEEYNDRQNQYISIPGREKRRQFVSDLLQVKGIHPTAVCWYDEGNCMYSTTDLPGEFPIVRETEEQGRRYRFTVRSRSATSGIDDLNQSSLRVIETLIKQALKEQFKAIGSVFYRWDEEPRPDGPYDLLTGFREALCLTESGPTLNVDITSTRFYPHSDLLPFIWERLLRQNEADLRGTMTDRQYDQIGDRLKNLEVTTLQSEHQDKYVLTGRFSNDLPGRTFIRPQENLLDYYKSLGFALRYPQLYCVKAHRLGKPRDIVDLPIELCSLREWQQVMEDDSINPLPAPQVAERYRSIMSAIKNCDFRGSELFREINLQVDCEEMMAVPYETLSQRQIILGRQHRFIKPVSISRMGFVYLTDTRQPNSRQVQEKLLNSFYDAAGEQRMKLPDNPVEFEIFADINLENALRHRLTTLKNRQCEFILCLENCRDPGIHNLFKQIACVELGLVTQCANFAKIQRMPNLRKYCSNLLQTVNAKLSGENKQVAELKTETITMFIGADVQHTKNNYSGELPSIAAVVASMNSECTLTNQRVSSQWPSDGKQSEEAILLLQTMVEELLTAFREKNNRLLPEHVVFYRDGVDDGQFERVLDEEVSAVNSAFEAIYPTNSPRPRLTFIVVKKRHSTRLFRLSSRSGVTNVESGVVVNSSIVHANPNYPNFFLNSHEPRLGTNKIGNYVVLVNKIEYPLSELEELTYSLCHVDQRIDSRSSESLPSVLHLADAAASNARQLFGIGARPPNAPRAEILNAHRDIVNKPNMF